jgi:pSer/pThr/pTyr-binding forkhead associated (FHA) protein
MSAFSDGDAAVATARFKLVYMSGQAKGRELMILPGQEWVFGRSKDVSVPLDDEKASRRHARIFLDGDALVIEDMDSANGTLVNRAKVKRAVLNAGDRIKIGGSQFQVVATMPIVRTEVQDWWDQTQANVQTIQAGARPGKGKGGAAVNLFSGSLQEIPLLDLLQLLCNSGKTGVVTTRNKPEIGTLHLTNGQICHATINGATASQPEKTIYRLLRWPVGTFEFGPAEEIDAVSIVNSPTSMLLMEGARQADEMARLEASLPVGTARLKLARPLPGRLRELAPEAIDVVQLVLEQETMQGVLDHFPGTDFEACTQLQALLEKGYLRAD